MAVDLVCDFCVEAQVGYGGGGEILGPSETGAQRWNAFVSDITGVARVVSGLTVGVTARYEYLAFPSSRTRPPPNDSLTHGELFAGFVVMRGRTIEHGPRLGIAALRLPDPQTELAVDVRYWVSGRISNRWSIVGEAGIWFTGDHVQASITAGVSFALSQSPAPPEEPESPPPKPKARKPGEYEPLPVDSWP